MENLGPARDQVGGYTGKWNRQIVEALDLGIRQRDFIEDQRDLLTGVEAFGELDAFAYSEFQAVGIITSVFLAAKRKVVERGLSSHDLVPVDTVHHLAQLGSVAPGGVYSANQAAHAGTGNVIHRNVMLLQPGNDADVRQPKSSAALQNQANRGPVRLLWLALRPRLTLRLRLTLRHRINRRKCKQNSKKPEFPT